MGTDKDVAIFELTALISTDTAIFCSSVAVALPNPDMLKPWLDFTTERPFCKLCMSPAAALKPTVFSIQPEEDATIKSLIVDIVHIVAPALYALHQEDIVDCATYFRRLGKSVRKGVRAVKYGPGHHVIL